MNILDYILLKEAVNDAVLNILLKLAVLGDPGSMSTAGIKRFTRYILSQQFPGAFVISRKMMAHTHPEALRSFITKARRTFPTGSVVIETPKGFTPLRPMYSPKVKMPFIRISQFLTRRGRI